MSRTTRTDVTYARVPLAVLGGPFLELLFHLGIRLGSARRGDRRTVTGRLVASRDTSADVMNIAVDALSLTTLCLLPPLVSAWERVSYISSFGTLMRANLKYSPSMTISPGLRSGKSSSRTLSTAGPCGKLMTKTLGPFFPVSNEATMSSKEEARMRWIPMFSPSSTALFNASSDCGSRISSKA
jgi:hypothetical protein